jgi:cytochrome b561
MRDDSPKGYGGTTRLLHWGMGLLILLQFLKLGDRIDEGEHWIGQTIVPLHVSVGAVIFVLAGLRLWWAVRQRPHRPQPEASPAMVRLGHSLLYACMFLLPLTGIAAILGGGYALTVLGVNMVEETGVETPWLGAVGSLHSPIAWTFVALVIGHIAAALFHHFVRRDQTLRRMLGQ